jgi:hypothetical protein
MDFDIFMLIFPLTPSFTTLCLKYRSVPSFVAGMLLGHAMLWSPPCRGWMRKSLSVFSAKERKIFSSVLTFTYSVDVTVNPISSVPVKLLRMGATCCCCLVED